MDTDARMAKGRIVRIISESSNPMRRFMPASDLVIELGVMARSSGKQGW